MSDTTQRIMDAAESRMRLHGYHAVSFRELADDLGIKSASVHYHFPQKEDLGLALVKRYSERFFAGLEANAAEAATPKDKLASYCKTYEQALRSSDKICLCGLLGAESSGLPSALSAAVAAFFDANVKWVWQALPSDMPAAARKAKATQTVATLQGAMMLATSLKDVQAFNAASQALLSDLV